MEALAVYCQQNHFIPGKRVSVLFKDIFSVPISAATLSAMCHRYAQRIQPVVEEIQRQVEVAKVKHLDETGFRIAGKTQWLHVASTVDERKFLGYRICRGGKLTIAPESVKRMKKKVRELSKRNRGCASKRVIGELSVYLRGWQNYFKLAKGRSMVRDLDSWIRRRVRCFRLKQKKRSYPIAKWLESQGVSKANAWKLAKSSKGWWRLSRNPVINTAMPNSRFKEQGLYSLLEGYDLLNV